MPVLMCTEHSRSIIVSSIAYSKVFPVHILIHEHPLMLEIIYVRPFNRLMLVEGGFSLFLNHNGLCVCVFILLYGGVN